MRIWDDLDLDEADAKISISGKMRRGERQRTADAGFENDRPQNSED